MTTVDRTYSVLHLFSGIGGGALGFQRARARFGGLAGRFETLLGVDVDAAACRDFEALTGAPALCADLATLTPEELRTACRGRAPDVVFLSAPCKGYSGLLPAKRLAEERYQKLNRLMLQGLFLVLETWPDQPPKLVISENVPRIEQRGADLIRQVRRLLEGYGYRHHQDTHCCGEIGGLAQRRRRWLLVARHEALVPTFLYQPPIQRVRAVGEVLGELPLPDDPAGGPMHTLPRLQWRTWERLALIPAGADWRALGLRDGTEWRGTYGIVPWGAPAPTVTANGRPGGSGAACVADPRHEGPAKFNNAYRVVAWDDPSVAVTGGTGPSSAGINVADPRFSHGGGAHHAKHRVERWDRSARTVTGADRIGSGAPSVADPRFGAPARAGVFGVLDWERPAPTVIGAADVHTAAVATADPRIPGPDERPDPPPVIIALDGTWHRPLTTLELAALQSFDVVRDGKPLVLDGRSHSRWREAIGNAVPPLAAQAMGGQMLLALLAAESGATFTLGGTDVWVQETPAGEGSAP